MTSVSWHSLARRELFEASDFYDAESAGLGNIFLDAVEHGVAVLKAQPGLGTPIRRETRWFVIARFPYSIVYRIDRGTRGGEARLYILAIAHQRRRPLYWAGRS